MAARVEFNRKAFTEIRKSLAVQQMLAARARRIADACGGEGGGYFVQSSIGETRARAVVIAGTFESVRQNATENTLVSRMDAGRG